MKSNRLISNEYYSLSELFSTSNRKIIIPDFQRDYCWGNKTHGEDENSNIVSGFLDTLLEEFKNNENSDVLLGKIDVYEYPKDRIYLTDGQQRITTLYLLMGMLYRKAVDDDLKHKLGRCLISDFEENRDDKEPYLQYAIRESTVFFLRDLVNEFFIKGNDLKDSDIKNQSWYFREYDFDPSIISMLSAIKIIDEIIKGVETEKFSEFIVNKIKIQYYDIKDKKHGEERFVIINTTGKSLTVSENVKPILLSNIVNSEFYEQWEKRETWFWKNRNKNNENIADDGVNQFLTWCFQIDSKQDEVNIIKKSKSFLKSPCKNDFLNVIQIHFESLKQVIEYLRDDSFQEQFMFINDSKRVETILDLRGFSKDKLEIILLPLLFFISKIDDDKQMCYKFLRRLRKNYFDKKWVERKVNYVEWNYVLQIIEKSDNLNDCLTYSKDFEQIENVVKPNSKWYNKEEKIKHQLSEHKQLLEGWEDHKDFMGDLNPLFDIVQDKTDLNELKAYFETFKKIDLDNFYFSDDIKLKNIYRLISYLNNGNFENRSVAGWGYRMLKKSEEKRIHRHQNFNETWKVFNKHNKDEIFKYLNGQLKLILMKQIFKDINLEIIYNDTQQLSHDNRVRLWAILEFLNTKEELNFNNSICLFWEYPNLVKKEEIPSEKNNYEIGNLLLGTSYPNNKSGWISFDQYPLMKTLYETRTQTTEDDIKENTIRYQKQLKGILQ